MKYLKNNPILFVLIANHLTPYIGGFEADGFIFSRSQRFGSPTFTPGKGPGEEILMVDSSGRREMKSMNDKGLTSCSFIARPLKKVLK